MRLAELKKNRNIIVAACRNPIKDFGTINSYCEISGIRYGLVFYGKSSMFLYQLPSDFKAYDLPNPFRDGGVRINPRCLDNFPEDTDWKVLNTENFVDRVNRVITELSGGADDI